MRSQTLMLAVGSIMLSATMAHGGYSFNSIGQTYSENFNSYGGTAATLPQHMFVTGENGAGHEFGGPEGYNPFTGVSNINGSGSFEGFGAFTNGNGDYSFGIRERGGTDLRDARLFLEITNNTGQAITKFNVSYDVEVWLHGDRDNQIRMKYNTTDAGFSNVDDAFATLNPLGGNGGGVLVDGSLAENRVNVSGTIDLIEYGAGALLPGETAFFRWQYSNGDFTSGSLRSGLAINNLSITPIPAPGALALLGLAGLVGSSRRRRS